MDPLTVCNEVLKKKKKKKKKSKRQKKQNISLIKSIMTLVPGRWPAYDVMTPNPEYPATSYVRSHLLSLSLQNYDIRHTVHDVSQYHTNCIEIIGTNPIEVISLFYRISHLVVTIDLCVKFYAEFILKC